MAAALLTRIGIFLLGLVAASAVIFVALEVLPGDPAAFMLGLNAEPETLAALRAQMGLGEPAPLRYAAWVGGMLTGDLGNSYTYKVPVTELVGDRVWLSLPLALYALALSTAVALPVGLLAAAGAGRRTDTAVMALTQLGLSIPNFWFGMMLVFVFALTLRWVGAGGFPGWEDPLAAVRALTLPAVALALPQAAILARVLRGALIEVMGEDYIRTARAKGLSRGQALARHALPNALIPVLTILGMQFSFLISGAIIIENVFFLPGLGRLVFQAITQRDLIVVKSAVMLLVLAVMLVTLLVDLAYLWADPRLRRR